MTLTLNQVLWIILTVAAVVAAIFLALFLNQLRRTAREGERTLARAQELMEGFKEIEAKINTSLDDVGHVLATSKKAVSGLSEITLFLTSKVIRPSAKFWPFLFPLVRFGLQQLKKRKEKQHGG
jgi:ABC-type transporter Mla subunit MlaD